MFGMPIKSLINVSFAPFDVGQDCVQEEKLTHISSFTQIKRKKLTMIIKNLNENE